VADELKFCSECGTETEGSKEEILFPKEDIANLKTELTFTKDDLKREIKYLKDEIKKIEKKDSGSIKILKRVHVFQFAVVIGFIGAISGFISGILMIPYIERFIVPMLSILPSELKVLSSGGGLIIFILLIAILYGIMGFIIGAIYAIGYNFIASVIGGIKITLSNEYDV
jgi:hypothetical protein